jgi:hypothetical protein
MLYESMHGCVPHQNLNSSMDFIFYIKLPVLKKRALHMDPKIQRAIFMKRLKILVNFTN